MGESRKKERQEARQGPVCDIAQPRHRMEIRNERKRPEGEEERRKGRGIDDRHVHDMRGI
jgi:hypothetical protein